jgi:thiol-disulfide isomerase/thioredoxin
MSIQLLPENFDQNFNLSGQIFNNKITCLLIKLEGCGPCAKFSPIFNEVASSNINPDILFADITVTSGNVDPNMYTILKIEGFPSTIIYINGVYNKSKSGLMQPQDLLNYIPTQLPSRFRKQQENFTQDKIIIGNSNSFNRNLDLIDPRCTGKNKVCVFIHSPSCGHCIAYDPEFMKLSNMTNNIGFLKILSTEFPGNLNGVPRIYLYENGHKVDEYTEYPRTAEGTLRFLNNAQAPVQAPVHNNKSINDAVVYILHDNSFDNNLNVINPNLLNKRICILVHHNSCGGCKQYIPKFIKASINDNVDSDIVFGMIDIDQRQNPLFLKRVSDGQQNRSLKFDVKTVPSVLGFSPNGLCYSKYGNSDNGLFLSEEDTIEYCNGIDKVDITFI